MSIDIEDYLRRLNTKDLISALSDLRHLLEDDIGLDWEQVDNFSMSNSGTKHSCGNAVMRLTLSTNVTKCQLLCLKRTLTPA
jgi:hypothetical protein